jgi:hypothetical protein
MGRQPQPVARPEPARARNVPTIGCERTVNRMLRQDATPAGAQTDSKGFTAMSSQPVDETVHVGRTGAWRVPPETPPETPAETPATEVTGPTRAPADRRRHGTSARDVRNSRIALLIVLLIGAGLVGLHIHSYRKLSVYDEVQHVDYVYRLLDGELPAAGDRWAPSTIGAVACRTIDYPAEYPECGVADSPVTLPNSGFTTGYVHTPAYYALPAGAVWVASLLPVTFDQISVMRATGILWLVAGIVLMWLFWRELRVPWQVRAGLALILVATPSILLAHGTVTNDATGLAAGAVVMLTTLRWDQGRMKLWIPAALALVALLLKATSLVVLLAACAFVLVRHLQRATADGRKWWTPLPRGALVFVGGFALVSAVAGIGWSIVSSSRAVMDERLIPQNITMAVDRFDLAWLPMSMMSITSPLAPQFLQSALTGQAGAFIASLVNIGLLSLAVVGAVRSEPGSTVRALAIATGAAMISFGPLLALINYFSMQIHFGIPARYGMTVVPALLAVAGTAVRTRRGGYALIALGLMFCAAIALRLLR